MGDWAKWELSKSELPERCYIFAGTSPQFIIDQVIREYKEVIFQKHDNYNPYILSDGKEETLILFQVYGAAMVADLLAILNDGKVKEIVFIGAAYGISKELNVGDYVIPQKVQCLDGVTSVQNNIDFTYPDENLFLRITKSFDKENLKYKKGTTISVPTTFWHPSETKYDKNAIALEMEFSSLCHFSQKLSIKSAGVLVISDTSNHSLLDNRELRYKNIFKAFSVIKNNIA